MPPALTSQQTTDRARAQLESGRCAALPELLKLVEALSVDICKVTIAELAEFIEKDGVVLTRILSVANRLAHNPGVAPITSLEQAIHQIGFNRVRNIAVSLMLLDKSSGGSAPEQREAAALTLAAGLIAQGAAEFAGTHDADFVFACTSLRNIGRVMMAVVSPAHYREAVELNCKEPQLDGFRRRFGVSVLELSRRVLTGSRFPEDVAKAMRDGEPESFNGVATSYSARLFAFCDYGHRLAALTIENSAAQEGYVRSVAQMSRRFSRLIPCVEDLATPALLHANESLRNFSRHSGGGGLPTANLARIRERLEIIAPGAVAEAERGEELPVGLVVSGHFAAQGAAPSAARVDGANFSAAEARVDPVDPNKPDTAIDGVAEAPGATSAAAESKIEPVAAEAEVAAAPIPASPPVDPVTPPATWDAGLSDSVCFCAQPSAEVAAVAPSALEMLRDAVGAEEGWLFRRAAGTQVFSLAEGVGPMSSKLPQKLSQQGGERSVFGLCVTRREVVLIHSTADHRLTPYLPAWWGDVAFGVRAFALVPVADLPDGVGTLILLGWREARRIELARGQLSILHRLFPAQSQQAVA